MYKCPNAAIKQKTLAIYVLNESIYIAESRYIDSRARHSMAATGPRGSRVESFSFTFLHLFVFLQLRLQFLLKCFRHIYKMVARTQFKSQLERKDLPNFTKQNAQLHFQLTGKRSGSTGYDATLQNKTHREGSVYQIKTHLLGSQILNE